MVELCRALSCLLVLAPRDTHCWALSERETVKYLLNITNQNPFSGLRATAYPYGMLYIYIKSSLGEINTPSVL